MRPSSVFEAGSGSNNPAETRLPSIVPTDDSFIDMSSATTTDRIPAKTGGVTDDSCIICYDAPREGACIPCGHTVGSVSCLKEIKATSRVAKIPDV